MGELKLITKHKDGDDGDGFEDLENIVITVCHNGYLVKFLDSEGTWETVYREDRDGTELLYDIATALGIKFNQ